MPALIAEGSSQRQTKETKTDLIVAVRRKHLAQTECDDLCSDYDEIAKMSSGLIQHLERVENRQTDNAAEVALFRPNRPNDADD